MFTPNYVTAGFKTKEEAFTHILSEIVQDPACAGYDGMCSINVMGQTFLIRPKKKKKEDEI